MTLSPETLQTLEAIVGSDRLSVAPADLALHAHDESKRPSRPPDVVIWPQTTAEVSAVLRHAHEQGIPVTGRGAGTSLEGNPIPLRGGIVLNFGLMNRIMAVHTADFQVTVQPGLFYMDMNRQLAWHGLFFAPDPGANASIGGILANNAAGIRTVKYGAARDNVLALEVVLANGDVIRTGSRAVKQSSGYDLTHLFVGSEGTLGIITEATLTLHPLPEHFSAAAVAFPTVEAAAATVFEIIGAGLEPAALELLDQTAVRILNTDAAIDLPETPHLFLEFSGANMAALQETLSLVEEICQAAGCQAFQLGLGRDERNHLWEARHRLFEIHQRYFAGQDYLLGDTAVPISQYPALIGRAQRLMAELGVPGSIISHAGDGNVHLALFYPPEDAAARANAKAVNEQVVGYALELDGTITGEHGVGSGKRRFMVQEHGKTAVGLMRQIKQTLDPKGILNPGKVLPDAE